MIGGRQFNVELEWNKSYGNLLAVKGRAKPKSPAEYKLIGKPGARRRGPGFHAHEFAPWFPNRQLWVHTGARAGGEEQFA